MKLLRFLTKLFQKQKPTEDELSGAYEGALMQEFGFEILTRLKREINDRRS